MLLGKRNTVQRTIILEELRRLSNHPTARELYVNVRKRLPQISLGTVYRNLEFLSAAGVIRKLAAGGAEARFDGCTEKHYHVRCKSCGAIEDIELDSVAELETSARRASSFAITGLNIEFFGLCRDCHRESASL